MFGGLPAAMVAVLATGASAAPLEAWQPTLSVRAGTLGVGPEVGLRFPGSPFGLRGNLNIFSYSDGSLYTHRFTNADSVAGYDLDARFGGAVRLLNGGLTGDYYPFGTGLRLSAGVSFNGDRITATAVPSGIARIGPAFYSIRDAGSVSLKALVNLVSPYVGFGYEGRIAGNLVASIDAGILVEGSPRVSLVTNGPAAALPAFNQEAENERRRIANDLDVPVYPVIELGIGYRF